MTKRPSEKDLLKDLDAYTSHADELAEPLPQELSPLDRLKGSVKRYDPVWDSLWEEDAGENADSEQVRDNPEGKTKP